MINKITNDLLSVFFEDKKNNVLNFSALNLALEKILKSEYFNDAYKDVFLMDRGNNFYELTTKINDDIVLLDPLEDIYFNSESYAYENLSDKEYKKIKKESIHRPNREKEEKIEEVKNEEIINVSEQYLKKLKEKNNLYQKILNPTEEFIKKRYEVKITTVNENEIYDFLDDLLGKYHDSSLSKSHIKYYNSSDNRNKATYIIAHNQYEIMGMVGIKHYMEHCNILSFISVADSFRNRNISKKIYEELILLCEKDKKILSRSSPSEFTRKNPKITNSYNELLLNSNILHVTSGSYGMDKLLSDYASKMNYSELVLTAKKFCDEVLKKNINNRITDTEKILLLEELKEILKNNLSNIKNNKKRIKIK